MKKRSKQTARVRPPQIINDGLIGLHGHLFDKHGHIRIEFHIVKRVANGAGYLAIHRTASDQTWSGDALLLSFDTMANREKCLLYFDVTALNKAFECDRRAVMGQAPAAVKD